MGHFAKVQKGRVLQVIVAEPEFIEQYETRDPRPGAWLQTSYNTRGGEHSQGGTPLRMNFAGVGYYYDRQRDAFIPPKPDGDWVLDESACLWVPDPDTADPARWIWSELRQSWYSARDAENETPP